MARVYLRRLAAPALAGAALMLAACRSTVALPKITPEDRELAGVVQRELASDTTLPTDEISVAADASEREVILRGVLTSYAERDRALELAKRAEPDLMVIDQIDVVPKASSRGAYTSEMELETRKAAQHLGMRIGESTDDAYIYGSIIAQLTVDPALSLRNVLVDVDEGTVTLRGRVASTEVRTQAEQVVRRVEGVTAVDNQITIGAGVV